MKSLWSFMVLFTTLLCSSHAYTFEVGGSDGWTLHPSENYNQWSGRLRFLINDTLHFKYDGRSDSVLVVNKGDYDNCNSNKPITRLDGGDSLFKFDRSGPFYFISGNKSNCDQGQKFMVVVLAPRNRSPPPPAATPPSSSSPPTVSPVLPPSPSSISPGSPSPASISPGSPSPASISPGSPSPASISPGSPSPASTPSGTPILTPPSSSPGGGSSSSPGGGSPSSPGGGSGQPPGSSNPAGLNTPPPPSSANPPLSGTSAASLTTMIFALWWFN